MKRPNSKRNLDMAIRRLGENDEDYLRVRTLVANAIVAGMMPEGAVKGGSALKIRFGDKATRATNDLDAARAHDLETFVSEFRERLAEGWNDFTGRLVPESPASPAGVPASYVMQPYKVRLSYLGSAWCTVDFELGHDEIGDAEDPDYVVPQEASAYLESLGFPALEPVPLMRIDHQIAQKLHAATSVGSARAHDLIDLQLIVSHVRVDYRATHKTCERLFAYRKEQPWPPTVLEGDGWDDLYAEQARGLDVRRTVQEAILWTNEFVRKIDFAGILNE